jgi:hypothetical protein
MKKSQNLSFFQFFGSSHKVQLRAFFSSRYTQKWQTTLSNVKRYQNALISDTFNVAYTIK